MFELMLFVAVVVGFVAWVGLPILVGEETSLRDLWYWIRRVQRQRNLVAVTRSAVNTMDNTSRTVDEVLDRVRSAAEAGGRALTLLGDAEDRRRRHPNSLEVYRTWRQLRQTYDMALASVHAAWAEFESARSAHRTACDDAASALSSLGWLNARIAEHAPTPLLRLLWKDIERASDCLKDGQPRLEKARLTV